MRTGEATTELTVAVNVATRIEFPDRKGQPHVALKGCEQWTWRDFFGMKLVPAGRRLELILRPDLIPEPVLHSLACDFAVRALDWVAAYRHDVDRVFYDAISAKRQWIEGQLTDAELSSSWDRLWDHGQATSRSLLWLAVWSATWDNAECAIEAATIASAAILGEHNSDVAHDHMLSWQLARVAEVMEANSD